ncbi:SMK killer toxin resistance protein [Pseudocyphellaria aurata]|nr:SMK killer toxin resistance protein [Pseudocyphellaria aurata]
MPDSRSLLLWLLLLHGGSNIAVRPRPLGPEHDRPLDCELERLTGSMSRFGASWAQLSMQSVVDWTFKLGSEAGVVKIVASDVCKTLESEDRPRQHGYLQGSPSQKAVIAVSQLSSDRFLIADMAAFLTDLVHSIVTPGPTHTLVVATNVSFAALQLCLLALLILTYSVHFLVLSFLSAGLWWAINWFVRELDAANAKEREAKQLRATQRERDDRTREESGTETEAADIKPRAEPGSRPDGSLQPEASTEGVLRRRISSGEASGDLSTDSEWDKVEEEGDVDR